MPLESSGGVDSLQRSIIERDQHNGLDHNGLDADGLDADGLDADGKAVRQT